MFTYPLMLYPVTTTLEAYLLPSSSLVDPHMKWRKNSFRMFMVLLTAGVAYSMGRALDNFVALVGGFCSVPLMFIYPPLLRCSLVGGSDAFDYAFALMGTGAMCFCTYSAIASWSNEAVSQC